MDQVEIVNVSARGPATTPPACRRSPGPTSSGSAARSCRRAIVQEAGPNAEYAYADFFKARISNANTRKAYKHAVDRFLHWCRASNIAFRQITSFLIGDYLEHHLLDQDGHPLAAPSKKQHLARCGTSSPTSSSTTASASIPPPSVRGPKHVAHEGKTPAFDQRAGQAPPPVHRHRRHRRPA